MLVFFPIDSMLWQVVSMVCAVCSLLSKEQGVTALGVCVVFDIATSSKVRRRNTNIAHKFQIQFRLLSFIRHTNSLTFEGCSL